MATFDLEDTIAAIASPPRPAARGLIRLSGDRSEALAGRLFEPDGDDPARLKRPSWRSGRLRLESRTLPAALVRWPGPRTYTGQPMAELHTVGSTPVLEHILQCLLHHGARLARPGEFTLRAFLSGRMDLTAAEAVLGVIEARSAAQLDAALERLAGGLARPIAALRDRLLDTLAHLEAGLDFVDEADVDPLARAALAEELERASADLARLADQLRGRDLRAETPRVVLVGPPNAGKSRLFNALLGDDRALVSEVAGTTRDYLCERCDCEGLTVELIDTAGLEDPTDAISSAAQARRSAVAAEADLRLDCRSGDVPALEPDEAGPDRLLVWTKADRFQAPPGWIATSASEVEGLDRLRRAIARTLRARAAEEDPAALTSVRCGEGLAKAAQSLRNAAATIRADGGDELVAIDLRDVVDQLGDVLGEEIGDEILDRIFRRFCIGK